MKKKEEIYCCTWGPIIRAQGIKGCDEVLYAGPTIHIIMQTNERTL